MNVCVCVGCVCVWGVCVSAITEWFLLLGFCSLLVMLVNMRLFYRRCSKPDVTFHLDLTFSTRRSLKVEREGDDDTGVGWRVGG